MTRHPKGVVAIGFLIGLIAIGISAGSITSAETDDSNVTENSPATEPDSGTQIISRGPIRLRLRAYPREAMVAEPIVILLSVEGPAKMTLTAPPFGERLGDFDVTSVRELPGISVEPNAARRIWMTEVTVECIRTGNIKIPPIEVACRFLGKDEILTTKPMTVKITSVLEESDSPEQIREMKTTIDADTSPVAGSILPAALACLFAFIVATVAILVYRKRQAMTPIAFARNELAQLRSMSPQPSLTDGYGRLSHILRFYLESKTGISATSQTTEELIDALKSFPDLDENLKLQIRQFVVEADVARYQGSDAGGEPPIEQIEELIDQIDLSPAPTGAA